MTINLGTAVSASGAVDIYVSGVKNPGVSGGGGTYAVETQNAGDGLLDQGTAAANNFTPGALISPNVQPASLSPNATGSVDVTFTTANPLPIGAKIEVVFPTSLGSGFILDAAGAGSTTASSGTMNGSFSVAVSGTTATITRTGGTQAVQAAGDTETITLTNVKNPDAAQIDVFFVVNGVNNFQTQPQPRITRLHVGHQRIAAILNVHLPLRVRKPSQPAVNVNPQPVQAVGR